MTRIAKLAAAVNACAFLVAACGGGGGDELQGSTTSTNGGAPTVPSTGSTGTKSVALQWSAVPTTAVSGTQTVQLAGQSLKNVEVFNGTAKVATAVVSSDGTSASASVDTTQFANGTVTLTAHAWDSAAGAAYTSDADAGPITLVVSNAAAATPTPTPATPTTPVTTTPTVVPTSSDLPITSYGAVCDGRTNNSTAIANAIAAAKTKGVGVVIPSGVCAYGSVINLDGVRLIGYGDSSVLYALDSSNESIFMRGKGAEVRSLKLSGVKGTTRLAAWEATRIALFGASNFVIDHVTIDGSAAAGIQFAQATNNGRLTYNNVKDTLSDSIHMTDRASYITLENNRIENAGDDGIAVVSYVGDGGLVNHITARHNTIINNKWGRNMSVVGGSDVLYENNSMEGNAASYACLYISQENSWVTFGASNVVATYNTMKNCGGNSTGHGAVMVFSEGAYANNNITLSRNDVAQSGQPGIRVFSALNLGVTLDSNRVSGASPALNITSPNVAVTNYTSGPVGASAP